MTLLFDADPEQKFACRDCPARCCRMPWRYTITEEERLRLTSDDWVRERLERTGSSFEQLPSGVYTLPTVEHDRMLQCGFLDEDELCSLHKRYGMEGTPQTCQTFPFGFIEKADGSLQAYLSHLCPSIRDNYGDPLTPKLPEKLQRMKGLPPLRMVPELRLGTGRLPQKDYLIWADQAASLLEKGPAPSATLLQIQHWTSTLAERLAPDHPLAPGWEQEAPPASMEIPSVPPERWAVSIRLLLATCFIPASYPIRVGSLRRGAARFGVYLAALDFARRMVQQRGSADVLFLPRIVELEPAFAIPTVLSTTEARLRLGRYLGGLLRRRNFFFTEKSLEETVFLLALSGAVVSVFARLRAAADGRNACTARDMADGESLAELLLTYHGSMVHSQQALQVVTSFMASYPPAMRGLVETF